MKAIQLFNNKFQIETCAIVQCVCMFLKTAEVSCEITPKHLKCVGKQLNEKLFYRTVVDVVLIFVFLRRTFSSTIFFFFLSRFDVARIVHAAFCVCVCEHEFQNENESIYALYNRRESILRHQLEYYFVSVFFCCSLLCQKIDFTTRCKYRAFDDENQQSTKQQRKKKKKTIYIFVLHWFVINDSNKWWIYMFFSMQFFFLLFSLPSFDYFFYFAFFSYSFLLHTQFLLCSSCFLLLSCSSILLAHFFPSFSICNEVNIDWVEMEATNERRKNAFIQISTQNKKRHLHAIDSLQFYFFFFFFSSSSFIRSFNWIVCVVTSIWLCMNVRSAVHVRK